MSGFHYEYPRQIDLDKSLDYDVRDLLDTFEHPLHLNALIGKRVEVPLYDYDLSGDWRVCDRYVADIVSFFIDLVEQEGDGYYAALGVTLSDGSTAFWRDIWLLEDAAA